MKTSAAGDQASAPRPRLFLSCAEATRLASAALDRPLGRAERVSLRVHLAVCRLCRRYRRQLDLLREILRRRADLALRAATPGLPAEARARLKRLLREPA